MVFNPFRRKAVIDEWPLNVSFRKLALQEHFGRKQVLVAHPLDYAANALAPTIAFCRFPPEDKAVHHLFGFVLVPSKGGVNECQVAVLPISRPAPVVSPHQTVAVNWLFVCFVFGVHGFDADI